ncbi:MAG: 2-succinyl-6-hydroxy-2,4-cyclohexadiene-1-carboxylate synthase [Balneolales bacterium]
MKVTVRGKEYWIEHHHKDERFSTLVMLHGFLGSSASFFHLTEPLTKHVNLVLIDLIGHGETDAPADSQRYAPNEQLDDLYEILKQFENSSLILHGYSMGGRLALQFVCRHPELLRGLILESTTAGISDHAERVQRKKLDRTRAMQILEDKDRFIKEWNNAALFQNRIRLPSDFEEQLEAIQQAQNSIAMQNSLLCFGTGSMTPLHDQLAVLNIPTLILAGSNDEKFKQEGHTLNRLIQNSIYCEIENASHRVHLDNPDAYLVNLIEFIEANCST